MKAHYKTFGGRLTFEVEGDTKAIFKQLAEIDETFRHDICKACGVDEARFLVRTVDENAYYEMVCSNNECRAKLSFGQNKKGGALFSKPKTKDGKFDATNWGWNVYKPGEVPNDSDDDETPAPRKGGKK